MIDEDRSTPNDFFHTTDEALLGEYDTDSDTYFNMTQGSDGNTYMTPPRYHSFTYHDGEGEETDYYQAPDFSNTQGVVENNNAGPSRPSKNSRHPSESSRHPSESSSNPSKSSSNPSESHKVKGKGVNRPRPSASTSVGKHGIHSRIRQERRVWDGGDETRSTSQVPVSERPQVPRCRCGRKVRYSLRSFPLPSNLGTCIDKN